MLITTDMLDNKFVLQGTGLKFDKTKWNNNNMIFYNVIPIIIH